MIARRTSALGAALLALSLLACSDDAGTPVLSTTAAPDFALQDVNPSSPTGGTQVSVRSHLGHVSAWYFAHAT